MCDFNHSISNINSYIINYVIINNFKYPPPYEYPLNHKKGKRPFYFFVKDLYDKICHGEKNHFGKNMKIEFLISMGIFFIGLIGIIVRKNLFIKLLSLEIMNIAVTIIFLLIGYNNGKVPVVHDINIFTVDPLPQNLVITAIIIGFASMALILVFLIRIVEKYRTLNINKLLRRFK